MHSKPATVAAAVSLEQAVQRLDGIENHPAGPAELLPLPVRVALPASYLRARRRRYPLLLLLDSAAIFGGAVEMSRLMAQTREVRECIVVGVDGAEDWTLDRDRAARMLAEVLQWCRRRYRVLDQECILFGEGNAGALALHALITEVQGVSGAIVVAPEERHSLEVLRHRSNLSGVPSSRRLVLLESRGNSGKPAGDSWRQLIAAERSIGLVLAESHGEGVWGLTDLLRGLRKLWGLPHREMRQFAVMRQPWLRPMFYAMAPLVRHFMPKKHAASASLFNPYRVHSVTLDRDFEVFVSLPESYSAGDHRSYPTMVVLDANIQFSTAAEAARAMARAGAMEEAIIIGVGTPRSEGMEEYSFRRFEEFSHPADDYAFDDELGQFFRGLYALRGQDARQRLGQAQGFLGFLREELLPRLREHFPVDSGKTALIGHSAAGTLTCFALFDDRSPFNAYAAFSPGIGISGRWLERKLAGSAHLAGAARKVVLTIGAEEEELEPTQASGISLTPRFSRQLSALGGPEVSFYSFDGESHTSTYPRALMKAYSTLFKARG